MRKRKKWSPSTKFEIVLLVIKGEQTLNDICKRYEVAATQVQTWKKQFLEQGSEIFSKKNSQVEKTNQLEMEQGKLKGRCTDNIYIERFWRSFKCEEFYLNEYGSVKELREGIRAYIEFYNQRRWHQALDYKTPASIYFEQERKACGCVDESFGSASTLRDVCTS